MGKPNISLLGFFCSILLFRKVLNKALQILRVSVSYTKGLLKKK